MDKYILRLCGDVKSYQDWLYANYPKEYHLHKRQDANIFEHPVEMHIISVSGGFAEMDSLVGYVNFEDYELGAGEGRIDIALLPEYVGKSLIINFMPALKAMACSLGYSVLYATTTIERDKAMRKCGYMLVEEWKDGKALYAIATTPN